MLLEKNDIKRLKDSPQDDLDYYAQQRAHCSKCCPLPGQRKIGYAIGRFPDMDHIALHVRRGVLWIIGMLLDKLQFLNE